MYKRILSLLLCAALCLGMLPVFETRAAEAPASGQAGTDSTAAASVCDAEGYVLPCGDYVPPCEDYIVPCEADACRERRAAPEPVTRRVQPEAAAATDDVTRYSYEITPILSPFCYYLYVRTDNPDPSTFRLVDRDSVLYQQGDYSEITIELGSSGGVSISSFQKLDPGTYYVDRRIRADVRYEDPACWRVKGGYIFTTKGAYSDGGSFVLQQLTQRGSNILNDVFRDTELTVSCPPMQNYVRYLAEQCGGEDKGFFETLDAVQSYLNRFAIYPGAFTINRSPTRPCPIPSWPPLPNRS